MDSTEFQLLPCFTLKSIAERPMISLESEQGHRLLNGKSQAQLVILEQISKNNSCHETQRIGGGWPLRAQGRPSSKIGDRGRQP